MCGGTVKVATARRAKRITRPQAAPNKKDTFWWFFYLSELVVEDVKFFKGVFEVTH